MPYQPKTPAEVQLLVEMYSDQHGDRLRELSGYLKDYALKHKLAGGDMMQTLLVMVHTSVMINDVEPEVLKMIDNGAKCIAAVIVGAGDRETNPNLC